MIDLDRARRRLRHARTVARLRHESGEARRRGLRPVHMLHVGKTGGTAVKAALRNASSPGIRLMLHPHGVSLADLPAADETFFFLRDPIARFVSGFNSRQREGRPAHYHPWTKPEREAFATFPSAEALALGLASTDDAERGRAEAAMAGITHVRSHLADWLVDADLVRARRERILLVGWQETLEADFGRLLSLLNLPPDLALPVDATAAHRAPSQPGGRGLPGEPGEHSLSGRRDLPDAAVAQIRSWYASDYALIELLEGLGLASRPSAGSVRP